MRLGKTNCSAGIHPIHNEFVFPEENDQNLVGEYLFFAGGQTCNFTSEIIEIYGIEFN